MATEASFVPNDARGKLLHGILVEHPRRSPGHDFAVDGLDDRPRKLLPARWIVREEKSLEIGSKSRVGPDITMSLGFDSSDRLREPSIEAIGFLVEVTDLRADSGGGLLDCEHPDTSD
jgi:hypothetical protein